MAFAGLAALGSLGMGIYGATQGAPGSNVQLPPPLPGANKAGYSAMDAIPGLSGYNTFGSNLGLASDVSMGLFNNPYAGGVQNAANFASPFAMAGGMNTWGAGGNLFGASNSLMNTAFDPQSALYGRTAQQLQDQTRTAEAARGIGTSPYGAGVEGKVMSDFNIDWQTNQLNRMLAGIQGAIPGYAAGSQMQQQGPVQYIQGAQLPYSTFQGIGQGQLGALQGLGQFGQSASAIPQMQQQDYSQYALGAHGGNVQGGQLGLNQAQLGFNQTQQIGQGLGWGLGGASNIGWGGPGWGGGSQTNTSPYAAPSGNWGFTGGQGSYW